MLLIPETPYFDDASWVTVCLAGLLPAGPSAVAVLLLVPACAVLGLPLMQQSDIFPKEKPIAMQDWSGACCFCISELIEP